MPHVGVFGVHLRQTVDIAVLDSVHEVEKRFRRRPGFRHPQTVGLWVGSTSANDGMVGEGGD